MRIAKDQHTILPSFLPSFPLLFLSHVFNHPPKSRHFRPSWSIVGSILLSLSLLFFLHDHFYRENRSMKPSIHRRVIVIDRDSRMLFSIRMHRSLSLRERERKRKEGKGETQGRRGGEGAETGKRSGRPKIRSGVGERRGRDRRNRQIDR